MTYYDFLLHSHSTSIGLQINGLKQSPKAWYERLTTYLLPLGYAVSSLDPCVFINLQDQIFIAIYVDDITLFGPPVSARSALKIVLKSKFQLTELDTLNWLLGIQIEYHSDSVTLSQ